MLLLRARLLLLRARLLLLRAGLCLVSAGLRLVRALLWSLQQRAAPIGPAEPGPFVLLEHATPEHEPQPQRGDPAVAPRHIAAAAQLEDAQGGAASQRPGGVVHHVPGDADLGVDVGLPLHLSTLPVRDDLDHHLGLLAELPDEVGAVPLLPQVLGQRDVAAHEHVRHDRALLQAVEDADVGRGDEGAAVAGSRPGGVEAARQQPLDLLRVPVLHRLIVLGHDVLDVRRRRPDLCCS